MNGHNYYDESILIVGAGAFGTSTAYHLAQRGYKNITVVDRFAYPSREAASTDYNKVVRSDYAEPLYARLAMEALEAWTEPQGLLHGLFAQSQYVLSAEAECKPFLQHAMENSRALGLKNIAVQTSEQVAHTFPGVSPAMPASWLNVVNPHAGWAAAGDALARMAQAAQHLGVVFVDGDEGHVVRLLFDEHGACIGALTRAGRVHLAHRTILAAGCSMVNVMDMQGQLEPKAHCSAHIQLLPSEVEQYGKLPVFANLEQGMPAHVECVLTAGLIFPPNRDGLVKISSSRLITNRGSSGGPSRPVFRSDRPGLRIPHAVEREMRDFVACVFPELAERDWHSTRICWDADTVDEHFLISAHPQHANLHLVGGGSAHGFKFLPIIGKYAADSFEGILDPAIAECWKWRPGARMPESMLPSLSLVRRDFADFEDGAAMVS